MKYLLSTLVLSFVCMFANADNKLHMTRTSDMCSDYYVLTMNNDTVYVTDYEYEQGTFVYYKDLQYFANSRLKPLMNKLVNIHTAKANYIKSEYENLLIDINVVNPTYHKCNDNLMAFYEMGTLYDKVGKLIEKVNNYTK